MNSFRPLTSENPVLLTTIFLPFPPGSATLPRLHYVSFIALYGGGGEIKLLISNFIKSLIFAEAHIK